MICASQSSGTLSLAKRTESAGIEDQITTLRPYNARYTGDHRSIFRKRYTEMITGGKTLKDLGYGFLGQYRWHVKDHINKLLDLGHHTCIDDPLEPFLVTTAILYGRHHKGMPRWPVIVERIGVLLADPSHAEWGQDGQGIRALAEMPPETPSLEGLTAALLYAPSS